MYAAVRYAFIAQIAHRSHSIIKQDFHTGLPVAIVLLRNACLCSQHCIQSEFSTYVLHLPRGNDRVESK